MVISRTLPILASAAALSMATPVLAYDRVTATAVFLNSTIPIKLMMLGLVVAMIAAVVVAIRKVSAGHISGGSTYISALRFGGPLLGLLGAALNGLWSFMGIASMGRSMPFEVYAPGLAEAMLVLSLGLLSGVVAVIANWAVEARVDRTVLKA